MARISLGMGGSGAQIPEPADALSQRTRTKIGPFLRSLGRPLATDEVGGRRGLVEKAVGDWRGDTR